MGSLCFYGFTFFLLCSYCLFASLYTSIAWETDTDLSTWGRSGFLLLCPFLLFLLIRLPGLSPSVTLFASAVEID